MDFDKLIEVCDKHIREYCSEAAINDIELLQNSKLALWKIVTERSMINIAYSKKKTVMRAPSMLLARIHPRKDDPFFFLPHEIKIMTDNSSLQTYIYPFIESEERMGCCIDHLLSSISELLPTALRWAEDDEMWESIKEIKHREIYRVFKIKDSDLPPVGQVPYNAVENYYKRLYGLHEQNVVLMRLTSEGSPFILYSSGNIKGAKAIYAKLEKKDTLTEYEGRLYKYIKAGKEPPRCCPPECDAARELLPYMSNKRQLSLLFAGILSVGAVLSLMLCSLILLISGIYSDGAILFYGCPWYFGIMLSSFPAMFGFLTFRKLFYKLFYRKKADIAIRADSLLYSKGISKFTGIIFAVVLCFTLLLTAGVTTDCVSFNEDGIGYVSEYGYIFAKAHTSNSYGNINGLYKLEGRYNDYGDYINRPSYVITFKNGDVIDLDGYTDIEETERHILPLIKPYIGEPVILHSDRELPK